MLFTKVIKGTTPVEMTMGNGAMEICGPTLHISSAVLKVSDNTPNKRVYLFVEDIKDDDTKAAICVLQKDKVESAVLDHFLDFESAEYKFTLSENAEVHLAGYWEGADDDEMSEEDEMDEESEAAMAEFEKKMIAAAGPVPELTSSPKPAASPKTVSPKTAEEDDEDDDEDDEDEEDDDEDDEDDEEEEKAKPAAKPVQQNKGQAPAQGQKPKQFAKVDDKKRTRPDGPATPDSAQKKMKQDNGSPMNKMNNDKKFNNQNNQNNNNNKFGGNKNNGGKFGGNKNNNNNNQKSGFDKNKKQGGKPFQKGGFGNRAH